MTKSRKPASDEFFLSVREREIQIGIARGKLTGLGGMADLRSIPPTPEDQIALKEKYGK